MIRFVILLIFLIVSIANAGLPFTLPSISPSNQALSASVKDANVNGLKGFNIKWEIPFKIDEYIMGIKYSINDLNFNPESFFFKRSFNDVGSGVANIDASFLYDSRKIDYLADWKSNAMDLWVSARGDTHDILSKLSFGTSTEFIGNKLSLKGTFDRLRSKWDLTTKATRAPFTAQIDCDNLDLNPLVSLSYQVNSNNVLTPSISLKDGDLSYRWHRTITGGSIDAKFRPGNSVDIEWKDAGFNGVWTTKAHIPTKTPSAAKISFSREWTI